MRRFLGAMLIAVAMVAVVGIGGVAKAQAAPGFFSFSVGSSGYGPAGYSASFGTYAPPVPYYAARPACVPPVPYGAAYRAVPYGPRPYGAYYRPVPPVPFGYRGNHVHYGYRGW